MLVQAQVVPWWGTGRPAEFSPSGTNPSRARIGGYNYKTESFQRPRAEQHAHAREMRNFEFFWCPPPLGVGVFGKLPAARKRKDRQRNRLGRSQRLRLSQERKPAGDLARQISRGLSFLGQAEPLGSAEPIPLAVFPFPRGW